MCFLGLCVTFLANVAYCIEDIFYRAGFLPASNGQNPTCYVVRLGPLRFAQCDQTTESLLLRQSLRDAGLESLIRQCCAEPQTTQECGPEPFQLPSKLRHPRQLDATDFSSCVQDRKHASFCPFPPWDAIVGADMK